MTSGVLLKCITTGISLSRKSVISVTLTTIITFLFNFPWDYFLLYYICFFLRNFLKTEKILGKNRDRAAIYEEIFKVMTIIVSFFLRSFLPLRLNMSMIKQYKEIIRTISIIYIQKNKQKQTRI